MPKPGKPIPDGFHTLTPHLVVQGCAAAIEFYKKAFDAEEVCVMPGPGGAIMHAEIKIGDSHIMMADAMPQMQYWLAPVSLKGTTVGLALYVADCDKVWDRAVKAGAQPTMPPMDAFWGDRYSRVTDPFGHVWEICTHKWDLTPEEIGKAAEEFFASMGGKSCG
jgi:uncharacterized glyoxalase superfamily protein PhnB